MSREEIREGVGHLVAEACYKYFNERTKATQDADYFSAFNAILESDAILGYLHSKGVVLKVDRELPNSLMEGQESYDRQTYKDMLEQQAGYVAVEDLIGEE